MRINKVRVQLRKGGEWETALLVIQEDPTFKEGHTPGEHWWFITDKEVFYSKNGVWDWHEVDGQYGFSLGT